MGFTYHSWIIPSVRKERTSLLNIVGVVKIIRKSAHDVARIPVVVSNDIKRMVRTVV
jgi:hypothetical protein